MKNRNSVNIPVFIRLSITLVLSLLALFSITPAFVFSDTETVTTQITVSECGNDTKEGGEICDGNDLNGLFCTDFGYDSGSLACESDCSDYNFTNCVSIAVCGDDVREGDELCDGSDLNSQSCTAFGYDGGDLACSGDCESYDTSDCYMDAPPTPTSICGNGTKESGEICDGPDLGGQTCVTQGYDGGDLTCSGDCVSFDVSECYVEQPSAAECGNNVKESGELCDGGDLGGANCLTLGYDYGSLSCNSDCNAYVDTGCQYYPEETSPHELCGNGVIDDDEVCDGEQLAGETCESFGFDGGDLNCSDDCSEFNTQECVYGYEICDNGQDDDNNGFVDCYDSACMSLDVCLEGVNEVCYNGVDDDDDSYVDCYDADCSEYEYCFNILGEHCSNMVDDNGNNATDCEDSACVSHQSCYEKDEGGQSDDLDELPETGDEEGEDIPWLKLVLIFGSLGILVIILIFLIVKGRKQNKESDGES